ncbi:MAG: adenosylmethionine--8-amino-7-oxononanoate transaminase [Planctomycetes bacterium]|nr:adenosylmethionine--8-amino-7-oxononanoate transaminase [Planctomycetota bacterium]
MRSASWRARDRRVLWHPFTQQKAWMEEDFPVIARARGSYLVDADGRRYLDGVSSLWCNVHGHRKREMDAAIAAQLRKVAHATFLGCSNPPAIELAEKLVAIAPKGLTRVFYSDDGSTAVEVALKMALQFWRQSGAPGKTRFLVLTEGYHGDTVGAMSLGGIDLYLDRFRPLLFETIHAPTTYAYRCKRAATLDECGRHCLQDIEAILEARAGEIAGIVVEPVIQGAGGMIVQPPGFLAGLRARCDKYGVLLVADEVMTGFGRTGRMFACEHEGVTPDLMAVSKGITGGYLPLAATLATERIYGAFLGERAERKTFFHGHTYTGNPLACAAALASLRLFEKEKVLERLRPKVHFMGNAFQDFYEIPQVGDIRCCGLVAGLELVKDPDAREPYPFEMAMGHRVTLEARKRGAILRPLGDVVVLMPPLSISMTELTKLLAITLESIRAAVGNPARAPSV